MTKAEQRLQRIARLRSRRDFIKIVSFDLGATFAWATNMETGLQRGHQTLPGIREERLAAFLEFLARIRPWMRLADVVVYETPFARGRDATRSLWGMAGVLEARATEMGLPVVDVAVSTIKKHATGRGDAPKSTMIDAARRRGYGGNDEHEADAFCLLKYAEENLEWKLGGEK